MHPLERPVDDHAHEELAVIIEDVVAVCEWLQAAAGDESADVGAPVDLCLRSPVDGVQIRKLHLLPIGDAVDQMILRGHRRVGAAFELPLHAEPIAADLKSAIALHRRICLKHRNIGIHGWDIKWMLMLISQHDVFFWCDLRFHKTTSVTHSAGREARAIITILHSS